MSEHKDIVDPNIHEPKGVSTAANNTSYKANGAGGGSWRKTLSADLNGISGDSGIADRIVVSDGAGGFKFSGGIAFGSATITNNAVTAALTAVADTTFNTPAQFILMTGSSFPWVGENLQGVSFTTDRLTVPYTGVYQIISYFNIGAFPSSSAKIALRFRVNGTTYGTRKPTIKSSGVGAEGQLIGSGIISLNAGDYIQNVIASDATGNLLIRDANMSIHLVG